MVWCDVVLCGALCAVPENDLVVLVTPGPGAVLVAWWVMADQVHLLTRSLSQLQLISHPLQL